MILGFRTLLIFCLIGTLVIANSLVTNEEKSYTQ